VQTIEGWRYHPVCLSCSVSHSGRKVASYAFAYFLTRLPFWTRSVAILSQMYITSMKIELIAKHICFSYSANVMFEESAGKPCSKICRYILEKNVFTFLSPCNSSFILQNNKRYLIIFILV
jgi:hypothetical protein